VAAPEARVDQDAGAGLQFVHAFACVGYGPGYVRAADVRELEVEAGQSTSRPQVEVIQCRGLDRNEHLIGAGFRLGHFGDL
jgi:hypothetical protein